MLSTKAIVGIVIAILVTGIILGVVLGLRGRGGSGGVVKAGDGNANASGVDDWTAGKCSGESINLRTAPGPVADHNLNTSNENISKEECWRRCKAVDWNPDHRSCCRSNGGTCHAHKDTGIAKSDGTDQFSRLLPVDGS